jgi:hypothetical protein
LKNPSATAASAGKYEFEIMSGTASFMDQILSWCRRSRTL